MGQRAQPAQGRIVFQRKAHGVEQRDLGVVPASRRQAIDDLPQLGHGRVGGQLLQLAFHARLGRELHEDARAPQQLHGQFGLAGAIAADGIDVGAGAHIGIGDHAGAALGGRDRGDDVGAFQRLGAAGAAGDALGGNACMAQVVHQLAHGLDVDVEDAQPLHAQQVGEGQGLEFDCDPAPISAMLRQPCRASRRAASAEVAAVRSAVASVRSDRKTGRPVATSARAPNAITVGRSRSALSGWPLTYLKA